MPTKALLLAATLLLIACEKPIVADEEEGTEGNQASLTVSVIELEETPFFDTTSSTPADACTHLNFAVYDGSGTRVKQINQRVGDTRFGTASFQLAEGTYQLVVVAHSSAKNPTMTNPAKIQFTNAAGFSDTFLHQEQVVVTAQSEHLTLSLKRIVSLCRFVITDEYPQDVVRMRFYYTGGSGAFDANTGLGCVKSKQSVIFDVTTGRKQFDLYTFLHEKESTIHLLVTAYDAADNVLLERDYDIPMLQYNVTQYTAPFFH